MPKKDKQPSEVEMQQSAIQAGLNALVYSNANFGKYAVLIKNNLDYNKIGNFIKEAEKKYDKRDALNELANYVASGKALKDPALQTLFDRSREGKLDRTLAEKIKALFNPNKFEGLKDFEKARNAYGDLYDVLSQDREAQEEIPELTKAARTLKMYGYLDFALKNFKSHGMMDNKEYNILSQDLYSTTVIRSQKGKKSLEDKIRKDKEELEKEKEEKEKQTVQKIAASIIGFVGIVLIISNLNITGAVIGESSKTTISTIGAFMIFFALLLFFRPLKKALKSKIH
jgi:predicted RND superfamily exporter protein